MSCLSASIYLRTVIDAEGNVWFWDCNPDMKSNKTPQKAETPTKQQSVTLGEYFAFLLDEDGVVWCCDWGYFTDFNENVTTCPVKKLEIGDQRFCSIAMTNIHALFVDLNSKVWSHGANNYGQLGLGHCDDNYAVATQITTLPKIICASAGYYHSLFVDDQGYVWCCGNSELGKLGMDTGSESILSIPKKNPHLKNIKSASAGQYHSLFLDVDGLVWGCGSACNGQLPPYEGIVGVPKLIEFPKATISMVSCGPMFSDFLDTEGNVWHCGTFEFGLEVDLLNKVEDLPPVKLIQSGQRNSLYLDCEGKLWLHEYQSPVTKVQELPRLMLPTKRYNKSARIQ